MKNYFVSALFLALSTREIFGGRVSEGSKSSRAKAKPGAFESTFKGSFMSAYKVEDDEDCTCCEVLQQISSAFSQAYFACGEAGNRGGKMRSPGSGCEFLCDADKFSKTLLYQNPECGPSKRMRSGFRAEDFGIDEEDLEIGGGNHRSGPGVFGFCGKRDGMQT